MKAQTAGASCALGFFLAAACSGSGGSPASGDAGGSPGDSASPGPPAAAGADASSASPGDDAGQEIPDAGGGADVSTESDASLLVLTSDGFLEADGGGLLFATSACAPSDQSPPFAWSGVPAAAASLALTFVDETNGATKWVVWNIPPSVVSLPAGLSSAANPPEIAGASQLGSQGKTGYGGPGVAGPPYHTYSFVLWALDVAALPGTSGLTTQQLRATLLPAHAIAQSAPFVAQGELGGP